MTADIIITIVLLSLSILLMLVEIFLLPGITVAGIIGGLFSAGGIWYAYAHLGVVGGTVALSVSAVLFCFLFIWLIRSKAINKIGLETNIESKVDTDIDKININDEGKSISRLNPIGKIKINDITLEGKAIDGFIDEGEAIIVVKKDNNLALVRKCQ